MGFLAFLSGRDDGVPSVAVPGVLVALGVVTFVAVVGLLFTTVLGASLTAVVETVSPPAFGLLVVLGAVLPFDRHPQARLPTVEPPQTSRPSLSTSAGPRRNGSTTTGYSPSSRPRTTCWISLVPSPISISLASR